MAAEVPSTPVRFSRLKTLGYGAFLRNGVLTYRDQSGEKKLFPAAVIGLKGAHNLENVLAACTMALLAGADSESLEESVRKFRGVEHRIEYVSEIGGVQYFNDSKATNVDAAVKSLEAFPGNILLIAGGKDKAGDFTVLRALVRERVKHLVLIGQAAGKIRQALSSSVATEAISCRKLFQESPGRPRWVLLAPACASH
jgi:UDP-N-acetylmuramoylalanine--D-glutamate ligase